MGPARPTYALAPETPFSFVSDRRATRGWYVKNSVAKTNLIRFLVFLKLFRVFI
jgi:hypothetical protein